jgi:hypothetical protein
VQKPLWKQMMMVKTMKMTMKTHKQPSRPLLSV